MSALHKDHEYHLVDPSPWPLIGAFSAFTMLLGFVLTMHKVEWNGVPLNTIVFPLGFAAVLYTMYRWWKDVIKEGIEGHHHTSVVRAGLRIGMALFIVSEVMFFFAFFFAFFKASLAPVLILEGNTVFDSDILKRGVWPPEGIKAFNPWDIPFMNTLILLLSGTTVTWAHHALLHNQRKELIQGLACTVFLGVFFTLIQGYEYMHATFCMNGLFDQLMHKAGLGHGSEHACEIAVNHIYPSNFFMATGFHGAHVIIGTIFLSVCLVRAIKGQLSPDGHLGFEFAAWYWHFVDVVWLFLFAWVYVWGS